jgi:molybdate transport system substrate-binding protein
MLRVVWFLSASVLAGHTWQPQPITVSAAISLTEAMREAARSHEADGGSHVRLNLAASNVLARQIVNGAPVDVFISADEAQMAVVERAGMVLAGSRRPLLGNQLAIVVRVDRAESATSAESLADPSVRRVAIANPEAVPAGVYARQYLERAGLWEALRPKLLPAGSVRAVLATVANGAADAGIVYVTDARASDAVRITRILAGPDAPSIVYPAALISSSRRQGAAEAFLKFLQTPAASRIFRHYGFQPLAAAGTDQGNVDAHRAQRRQRLAGNR